MAAPRPVTPEPARPFRNRLLAALPEPELARLAPALERICMESRQLVFDVDTPIQYVYFPENAVISIVGVMCDGSAVETASIGWEGMGGLPVFLGAERTLAQAFCQIPGEALRLEAGTLQREVARGGELRSILNRYTQAHFTQIAQAAACNRLHTMRQRCARWLLHTHDRVGRDEFPLTQRFLSQMLGVRRATVTEAARSLQQAGLISYVHGRVTLGDRLGLERVSCECYAIVQREFERLLEGRVSPSPLDGVRVSVAGLSTTAGAYRAGAGQPTARARAAPLGERAADPRASCGGAPGLPCVVGEESVRDRTRGDGHRPVRFAMQTSGPKIASLGTPERPPENAEHQ